MRAAVTVGSIRWRILKVSPFEAVYADIGGYSGFDPMEDTESTYEVFVVDNASRLQWVRSDGGY